MSPQLQKYCDLWNLQEPKLLASTLTSDIFKVQIQSAFAVLKVLSPKGLQFESKGSIVLKYFKGHGAINLLQSDEGAHLLEFIDGEPLKDLVARGDDAGATEIVADIVSKLHSVTGETPAGLIDMQRNFQSLFRKVKNEPKGSIYIEGEKTILDLLKTQTDVRVLHGDLHHKNILRSSTRGWLAIDPQCLVGERTYDLANAYYNPSGFSSLVESSETIKQRSSIFSRRLHLDPKRILSFAFAYGCLSACWSLEDGLDEKPNLSIAERILEVLKSV